MIAEVRGPLLGKGGLYANVVRLKPPMCLTKPVCDFLVDCLDGCFDEISGRG